MSKTWNDFCGINFMNSFQETPKSALISISYKIRIINVVYRMGVPRSFWKFFQGGTLVYVSPWNVIPSIAHRHVILLHMFPSQKGVYEGVPVHWSLRFFEMIQSGLYRTKHPTFVQPLTCWCLSSTTIVSPSWPISGFSPGYAGRESCWGTCFYNASSVLPSLE